MVANTSSSPEDSHKCDNNINQSNREGNTRRIIPIKADKNQIRKIIALSVVSLSVEMIMAIRTHLFASRKSEIMFRKQHWGRAKKITGTTPPI